MSVSLPLDWLFEAEIQTALDRVENLLDSKILWDKDFPIYQQSVLIEVLINMKDLLIKANKLGNRISFNDDIAANENFKIHDVTDLISNFRDAVCHNDSFRRKVGPGYVSAFNVYFGSGLSSEINGVTIGSSYEDDIGYETGHIILYQRRHIERAFQELKSFFEPLIERSRKARHN